MIVWTATLAMQAAIMSPATSEYQVAYNKADAQGKHFLVLVGSDTNPDCRTMKTEKMPKLNRKGELKDLVFTTVDQNKKPDLSRRLVRGEAVPQLVLYAQTGQGWKRSQLDGVHGPAEIERFLKREIAAAKKKPSASESNSDWQTSGTQSIRLSGG